ncbi:hypothetical protein [Enterovirga rhinocerotis]|uniref:Uncharacterized protein n=1 Tax=Enterovirga rhinocerotis TaxID=1339210 RepID=A0A4R7BUD3_9HYPH|nr:hypothetical protein [Enterovirga rhinocerotis]TDR89111.1 hypothetical protein EV668_3599 [Enterovirga rhinocerotis]
MTACNIFVLSDQIRVWTDGAAVDTDGHLIHRQQKVGFLPHLNAVVVIRGPALAPPMVELWLGSLHETFDDLVDGLSATLRGLIQDHADKWEVRGAGSAFELLLAGFSESRKTPEVYWIEDSRRLDDIKRRGAISIVPADDVTTRRLTEAFPGMSEKKALRSDDVQLRLMELQRDVRARPNFYDGLPSGGVGAFAQLTTVTRSGISTRIVRRWPDRIGKKLGGAS